MGAVAGRVAGREYTSAELVGLLNPYNDAEVEAGQMAQKATDRQVCQFTQRIVGEHQALKPEVTNTAQRLNLAPVMPKADERCTRRCSTRSRTRSAGIRRVTRSRRASRHPS